MGCPPTPFYCGKGFGSQIGFISQFQPVRFELPQPIQEMQRGAASQTDEAPYEGAEAKEVTSSATFLFSTIIQSIP